MTENLRRYNSGACQSSSLTSGLSSNRIMTPELIEVVRNCAESLRDNKPLLVCGKLL